jgi:hypothetical protein
VISLIVSGSEDTIAKFAMTTFLAGDFSAMLVTREVVK